MEPLTRALTNYAQLGMYPFHTPGHKGRRELLGSMLSPANDLTELPELDMLHNPQGVIGEAQNRAAEVYGSEETFFLVNGATVGNQAMFLALAADPKRKGKKIRIQRNAHRSVAGALILSGLTPEYVLPVIHPDFNLPLGLNVESFLAGHEDIGGFHLTSPSYYGTIIDLEAVFKCRDRENPDLPILVDQAHGAHYVSSLFPQNAVRQGADLVVHSTHKTMAALTQAAMLHVRGQRINRLSVRHALELLQTSSPSYLLMGSLEKAVCMEKEYSWKSLHEEVLRLHDRLEDGPLRVLNGKDIGFYGIRELDWSKLLVNVTPLGLSAPEAVKYLRSSFRIEPELWDEQNILFMLGIGNKPEEVRNLGEALESLSQQAFSVAGASSCRQELEKMRFASLEGLGTWALPPVRLSPREAWVASKEIVKLRESKGRISGETVSAYPPGIPLVVAGEEITAEILDVLHQADKYAWQGWDGFQRGEILVISKL